MEPTTKKGMDMEAVRPSENQSGFPALPPEAATPAEELKAIAAEQGLTIDDSGNAQPEAEPAQPKPEEAAATPPPNVPDKFKKEDGGVDVEKVTKSTVNAEEALAKYLEKEKALRQAQARVNQLQTGLPQTAAPQTEPQHYPPGLEGLAKQIEDEAKLNGLGVTLAKLFQAADNSAYGRARQDFEGLAEQIELNTRRSQLQDIAKRDAWAITPEGQNILMGIRDEIPSLNGHPNPWQLALEIAKGRGLVPSTSSGGVKMPTPTSKAGAPVPPASGPRTNERGPEVDLNDPAKLNAYLSTLSEKDEAEFWRKQGVAREPYI